MQFLYKLYIFIIFKKIFCIHSYKRKFEFYGSFKIILIPYAICRIFDARLESFIVILWTEHFNNHSVWVWYFF